MAIGFIYGPQLNQTLDDPNYFSISAIELNTTQGKGVQTNLTLNMCPTLDWLADTQKFYQNLSCIDNH